MSLLEMHTARCVLPWSEDRLIPRQESQAPHVESGLDQNGHCPSISFASLYALNHWESLEPLKGFSSRWHSQPGRKSVASELEIHV